MIGLLYSIRDRQPITKNMAQAIKGRLAGKNAEIRRVLRGYKKGDIMRFLPFTRVNSVKADARVGCLVVRRVNGKRVKSATDCAFLTAHLRDDDGSLISRARYTLDLEKLGKKKRVRELMDYVIDKEDC